MATNSKTIAVLWTFTQYIARGQSWMQLHVIVETRGATHKDPEFEESQETQGMPIRTGSRDSRKCWESRVLWFPWSMRKLGRLDSSVWKSFLWTTLKHSPQKFMSRFHDNQNPSGFGAKSDSELCWIQSKVPQRFQGSRNNHPRSFKKKKSRKKQHKLQTMLTYQQCFQPNNNGSPKKIL